MLSNAAMTCTSGGNAEEAVGGGRLLGKGLTVAMFVNAKMERVRRALRCVQ